MVPQPPQALPLPPGPVHHTHEDSDTTTTTATADGRPAPLNPDNRSLSRSQAPIILSPGGKPCLICFDKEKDGVQCAEGHFVCRGCLQGFIRNLEPVTIRRSGGCISCPWVSRSGNEVCQADPWSYDDLVNLLEPATQRMYVQRLEVLLASVLQAEVAQTGGRRSPYGSGGNHSRRSSRSNSPLPVTSTTGPTSTSTTLTNSSNTTSTTSTTTAVSTVPAVPAVVSTPAAATTLHPLMSLEEKLRRYRLYIAEEILTLKCPREGCRRAFLDFDGCFALTCPSCGCGFCAACILDCGDDAHEHCRSVHQGYFGTIERFNEIQRHKRLLAVTQYLGSLQETPTVLDQLLCWGPLKKDLTEVGLTVEEVRQVLKGGSAEQEKLRAKFFQQEDGGNGNADGKGQQMRAAPGGAGAIQVMVRLDAGAQGDAAGAGFQGRFGRLRRFLLEGPGYPDDDDHISRALGTVVTASTMVALTWWMTSTEANANDTHIAGIEAKQLFWGLIAGPSVLLLLSGRGRQLLQALYVTFLTALLCVPIYFFSGTIVSWIVNILARVCALVLHLGGFALDVTLEGTQIARVLVEEASMEMSALYATLKDTAPRIDQALVKGSQGLSQTVKIVAGGLQVTLDVLGLLPEGAAATV